MQFLSTDSVHAQGIKTLVYGGAGTGKTTLCATAPAPVIISVESGLLSLSGYSLPYIVPDSIADLYALAAAAPSWANCQTVCLDSLTEIAEKLLSVELKRAGKDPRRAYGEMATQMLDITKAFRDIPGKNVYVSAKMERSMDGGTNTMLYQPMMPGQQVGQQLPYLFDEVFQLHVYDNPQNPKEKLRILRTQPDAQYTAKDRSGKLDVWETPDLTHIFNKIAERKQ